MGKKLVSYWMKQMKPREVKQLARKKEKIQKEKFKPPTKRDLSP